MNRVDPSTLVCHAHEVHGCIVCMVDDFQDWTYERAARRRALKQEWRETPVEERFDLGGEA